MFRSASNALGVDGVMFGAAQGLVATPPDAVGTIQTTIGPVTVMRAGGVVARVDVGEFVYQGDAIATGPDGAVGIIFADGTVFNLSSDARAVLNELAYDPNGNSNSALLSLAQGKFAFIAGKVAKTGGLRIDTPFASIRGSARDRGVGVLTLAALTFAAIEESQAASRHDAFLDDGTITYKDLPHGTFEIVTRDGRVIMSDDPGETIVVDPTGAVTRIPNSSSRMAELQQAQHSALATFSLGQEGGAAGGSSSPGSDIPVQLQPINFSPPRNDAPSDLVTTHITAASSGFIPELKPPEPKPPVPALGLAGFSMVTETVNTTGSTHLDTVASGTLTFTDFKLTTVSATMASMTWSGGATPPSGLAEVLAGALSITTESADPVSGSIATIFGAADNNFDFLAANETLTIVYDVTATDNSGVSLTRPVTITITGTNDAPVLAADASGPHTVAEGLNTTGTFVFTDVDLTDHHTVSTSVTSATWSGGATLPSGVAAALAGALSTTVSDGTGPGSGSVAVTFSAADSAFDFLAAGQTLKITYNVTLADNSGVSSSQPVTFTVTGTNDAPVITAQDLIGAVTEQITPSGNLTDSGTITFTDVDLTDVHLVSATGTPIGSVLGTLTAVKNSDTTGTGAGGQLTWTYTVADSTVAFLAAGQTKVESFIITLDDQHGGLITKQIDVTITGTDDGPVITAQDLIGAVTEQITPSGNLTDSGIITFTDVDLTDVHLVSATGTPIGSVLGTLTAVKNTDTTGTGTGGQLTWTYTVADSAVEFLAAGQTKVESFTITLDDQHGGLITRQIDVTITGTDDVPLITAQDLIGAVTEQITPAGNLTDSGTITFTDVDLTDVHLVSATGTPIGSVLGTLTAVKNSDTTGTGAGGQLTWTYTVADSAVEFLAAGQTKVESFTITLDDQHGGLITRQVDVTITGTNDGPLITAQDLIGAVTEQITPSGNLTDSGTITFTDVDLTDVHLVSATGTPIGSVLGTLTAVKNSDTTGTGAGGQLTWTYTVADSAVAFLAAGQTKVESFTITLDDQHGGLITRQIDVTITGTDDGPVITAQDLIGAVTEQITPSGNLTDSGTITFTDVDLTDVHLVSATGTPIGSVLGTLTAVKNSDTTGTGAGGQLTWTYTVADSAVEFLAAGQTKVESFTITLDDQHGGLITRQVDVTITGTNDGPLITAQDLIGAVTEQITPSGNLTDSGTITFTDVDLTDVHLVSATGTPIGSVLGTLTAVKNSDTTGTGAGGQLTWTYTVADSAVAFLAAGQTKVESFTITLDDQHGGLITKQIDVTITGTDDGPVITAQDLIGAVTEQITPSGNLTDSGIITFTDIDLTDVHLVSATGTPIGSVLGTLTAVKNTDTTGTGTGGQLTWTYTVADSAVEFLAAGQTKVESFTITLDDQHGGLITKQIDVTITGTDDVPLITAQDLIGAVTEQITPAGNLTDSGTITFTDVDLTDVHLVSATGTPIGSVLGTLTAVKNSDTTGTGAGGQLTWTYTVADSAVAFLAAGQTKVESFTITLDDQHGGLITKQIDVTITGTDDGPVITAQDLIGAVTEQITPSGNLTDSGIITFTDVDLTDVHLVSATGTPIGSVLGTLTAVKNTDTTGTGTGGQLTWTYTVADSAVEFLAAGQTKVESFTITLDDQHGGLITKQIDVTITGTDDVPLITAQDLIGAVTEQTTPAGNLTDSGTITFTDVDLTDVHLVSATGTPIGSVLGTLTAVKNTDTTGTGTGGQLTWTYTVADSAVEFLAAGQTKVESFTITLDDQHGGVITRQIDVTITGTADARVIAPGTTFVLSGETVTDPLIQNNGTILVQSNNQSTVLGSIITGTGPGGNIEIKNNSTLQIDGSVDSGQTVFFSVDPGGGANSKLVINDPLDFHAKISDFSGNDQLDLGNFVVSSITYVDNAGTNTGGTLKIFGIFNGNGIVTEVDLIFVDGDKTTPNFTFASDGNNGTTIVDPPTSTKTLEATVIPVVGPSTLTATTADNETNATSVAFDKGTAVTLDTASSPDGGEMSSVTISALPSDVTLTDDALVDANRAGTDSLDGADAARLLTINGAGAVDHGSLTLNGALTLDAGAFQLAIKQQRKRDNADGRHSDRANGDLQAASIGIGAAVLFLIEHGNCTIAEAATYGGSSIAENDAAGTVSNSDAALKFNTIARPISGALADGGTVEVAGGRLDMADTASATGVLKIDAGATLQFDGDRAVNVTLAGSTGELGSAWTFSDHAHGGAVVAHQNTGNHGPAAQSRDLSSQAASHAPSEIPLATSNNGANSLLLPISAPNREPGNAASPATEFVTDHLHPADANTGNHGLEPQSLEPSSQAALQTPLEIPPATADNGATNPSDSFNSPALPTAANDSASQAAQDRGPPGAALAADHGKDSNSGHDGVGDSHAANKIHPDHSSPALPSAANDSASQAAQDRGPPGAAPVADHGKDSNSGHDGVGDPHAANKIHPDHSSPALPSAANDSASQAAQDRGPPGAALAADHGKDSNSGHDGVGESHAANKIPSDHSSPALPSAANDSASQAAQDRGPPGAALAADHGKDSNSGHDGVGESHAANKIPSDHSSPALPSAANDSASQAAQDRGPPGAALAADHGKDSSSGHDGVGESHAANKIPSDHSSPALPSAANDSASQAAQDPGPPGAALAADHGKDSNSGHDGVGESHAANKIPSDHSSPALPSAANDSASQAAQDPGPPGAALAADRGNDSNSGHDGIGESHAGNKAQFDQPSPALPTAANDSAPQAAQDPGPPGGSPVGNPGKDQFAFDSHFGHDGESPAGNTTQFDQPSPALTTAANDSAAQAAQNPAPPSAAPVGDHAKDQFAFDSNFGHDGIGESHAGNTTQFDQPSPALTTAANDSASQAAQNPAPLSAAPAGDHAKDQFAFDSNFGHDGIGESHAGNMPQPDQQIFQTVSDILAHTAEAHSAQAVAADGQNHDAALTPVQKDKPLSDFIIHA